MVLPDLLQPNLRIVFCGTAAGHASAERGAYYAHPGNRFYRILHETGLTSRLYAPSEFRLLLHEGIGLTDVNKTESGNDHELTAGGFDADATREKILHYQPRVLAFTSKRAAREFLGLQLSAPLAYGRQEQQCGNTHLYVMPSTSGAAAASWDARYWHLLANDIMSIAPERSEESMWVATFDTMSVSQWHAIMTLRASIFVVEQHCFYLDPDAYDPIAWHVCCWQEEEPVAYLRILPPGSYRQEIVLGRICVSPAQRGSGIGRKLILDTFNECHRCWPQTSIVISAQAYLTQYYERLGFVAEGHPYDDAGVAHIQMRIAVENP